MLATSEAPGPSSINLDRSPRSCSDHTKHTLSRSPNVIGRVCCIHAFQAGAAVGSSHRQLALGAKSHGETLSLPLVIHGCQHQPTGIAGCHDMHRAHAKLAKTGPHARHLVLGGRDHDDHHARLPQDQSGSTTAPFTSRAR